MKRTFEIEFEDDLGPLWMNRDNLIICLSTSAHVGGGLKLTVQDLGKDCDPSAATITCHSKTLEQCREIAAEAWCMPKTASKIMDMDLAEAFAEILHKRL
jgi:hypothetical protein